MTELVDRWDLESHEHYIHTGSNPVFRTLIIGAWFNGKMMVSKTIDLCSNPNALAF